MQGRRRFGHDTVVIPVSVILILAAWAGPQSCLLACVTSTSKVKGPDLSSASFIETQKAVLDFRYLKKGSFGYYVLSEDLPHMEAQIKKNRALLNTSLDADFGDALHYACWIGHLNMARLLIKLNANVNSTVASTKRTPIMMAACHPSRDSLKVIQLLVDHKADLRIVSDGDSVMEWAISGKDLEIVKYLAGKGLQIKRNALTHAGMPSNSDDSSKLARWLALAKWLIDNGADVNAIGDNGETVLDNCQYTQPTALEFLLKRGAKVAARDKSGLSPLEYCAKSGVTRNVRLLLEFGAAKGDNVENAKRALELAQKSGHTEVVKLIQQALGGASLAPEVQPAASPEPAKPTSPISIAAMQGNIPKLKRLVTSSEIARRPDDQLRTPLHYAALGGKLEAVQWLIEHGASLNPKDNTGATPLALARRAHDGSLAWAQVINYLADLGAVE